MRKITLAITQMASAGTWRENCDRAEILVREAAAGGAGLVLLQELFDGDYFCIEQHVEFIADAIAHMRKHGLKTMETTEAEMDKWVAEVNRAANATLLPQATHSWYLGANVPGKPRVFLPYPGGVGNYRNICNEVRARDYIGFARSGPSGSTLNDGIVRRAQSSGTPTLGVGPGNVPVYIHSSADLPFAGAHRHHVAELHLAVLSGRALHPDDVAGGDPILLPAAADDRVHSTPSCFP